MMHTYSIIDGNLDGDTRGININIPNRVMAPIKLSLMDMLGGVMSIRAWHVKNYQDVREFCEERNLKLLHVYDNIRELGGPEDYWSNRFGGKAVKALVVEFESLDDAMMFKLSWPTP